jgi:type I restriction enzyme R subunit
LRDAAAELVRDRSAMLPADANAEIYRLLRDGVPVQVRGPTGERKTETARVIDWRDPNANDLLLAQQVWFQGELYRRRADLVGFVNGLPLLLIELKGPAENVKDAFDNNIRSYRSDIPQVFAYNAAVIVCNGMETKVGATFAPYEHFIEWKRPASTGRSPPSTASLRRAAGLGCSGIRRAPARACRCSISRRRTCARNGQLDLCHRLRPRGAGRSDRQDLRRVRRPDQGAQRSSGADP